MKAASVLLLAVAAAQGCTMQYTNKAKESVTVCMRVNGGVPGAGLNRTLAPGASVKIPCRASVPGQSSESYFALPGLHGCGWDQGCSPDTGSCHSYPWVMGQGVGTNGLWYGAIGANWDGAGMGYTGGYGKVTYGLHFSCSSYNGTQFPKLTCGVKDAKPYCTPNHPNYNQPSSGVVECDADQVLKLHIQ